MEGTGVQQAHSFRWRYSPTLKMNYLLYLPRDYSGNSGDRWPLILFLHGAGERGNDLERVKTQGLPKMLELWRQFPFIVASPQCPPRMSWSTPLLSALMSEVESRYLVDADRIYVTGMSMGGYATWSLALEYPDRFAAIAPVCGGGDPSMACRIMHLPVWAFHGARDYVVPLEETLDMVEALKECGGNVKVTIYPEAEHDSWTQTYDNPELYQWLLHQKRESHTPAR